jgi:hypothetical protein
VQVSATVRSNPPTITLTWAADSGATNYTLRRKLRDDTSWRTNITLARTATSYVDTNVAAGSAYEYGILKQGSNYSGYGYIYAGIAVPMVEDRGKVLLLVESSQADSLATELARLQQDLAGDYGVRLHRWGQGAAGFRVVKRQRLLEVLAGGSELSL